MESGGELSSNADFFFFAFNIEPVDLCLTKALQICKALAQTGKGGIAAIDIWIQHGPIRLVVLYVRVPRGARQTHQNTSCVTRAGAMTTATRNVGLERLKIRTF
jgi:hypothetical protein